MQMLYNSDSFAVVRIDVPEGEAGQSRGGYEIVDKFARKGIFIDGALAQSFQQGVEALMGEGQSPSEDDFDAYLGRFSELMQQPMVMH